MKGYRYRTLIVLVATFMSTTAHAVERGNSAEQTFLLPSINNNHPFVGQEVLLTYRLYFKDIAPAISEEVNPSLHGVWAKESLPERHIKSQPVLIHGKAFRNAIVKQFRLIPLQSGKINISGYSMLCTLPQEGVTADGADARDSRLRIKAPGIIINATPLPEPVPAEFSGAVGTFRLELLADKSSLHAEEPLRLKLILTGEGSLLTLKLPEISLPESFRQNTPDRTNELDKEPETTSGSIITTLLAWPQSTGNFKIPAVRIVVFDPDTREFRTLTSKPLDISVTPKVTADDAASPKSGQERTKQNFPFFTIAAAGLLLLLIITLLIRQKLITPSKKSISSASAPDQPGNRRGATALKQQLFALIEEIGIKSPSGLTRVELKNVLHEIGISDEEQSEILKLLDSLDMILYTPAGQMESLTTNLIAEQVDNLLKKLKKNGEFTLKQ